MANGTTAVIPGPAKLVVNDVLMKRLTQATVTTSTGETAWGDSDGEGYTLRKAGRLDATLSMNGKVDNVRYADTLFVAGDVAKLVVWEDASRYWAFSSALVQSYELLFDNDTREVVGWTASAGADGNYYKPGQSGAPSESLPAS